MFSASGFINSHRQYDVHPLGTKHTAVHLLDFILLSEVDLQHNMHNLCVSPANKLTFVKL